MTDHAALPPAASHLEPDGRLQLLVRFGYEGQRFHGLQPQGSLPTAGSTLRSRLEAAFGARPKGLAFAARTDAGVHALSNLATCFYRRPDRDVTEALVELARPRADGLFGVRAFQVPRSVHARGSSVGKRYRYIVDDSCAEASIGPEIRPSRPRDPSHGLWSWRVAPRLERQRLEAAVDQLVGTHDFSSFRAAGCTAATPVTHLGRIAVRGPYPLGAGSDSGPRRWLFEVSGDRFLRKMVRNLVGTLVEVGSGWRPAGDVAGLLAARDRQQAGLTAPARGLTLLKVGCIWPEDGSGRLPELSPPR